MFFQRLNNKSRGYSQKRVKLGIILQNEAYIVKYKHRTLWHVNLKAMVLGDRQGLKVYWGFFFRMTVVKDTFMSIVIWCYKCQNNIVKMKAFFNYNYTKSCHRGTLRYMGFVIKKSPKSPIFTTNKKTASK